MKRYSSSRLEGSLWCHDEHGSEWHDDRLDAIKAAKRMASAGFPSADPRCKVWGEVWEFSPDGEEAVLIYTTREDL